MTKITLKKKKACYVLTSSFCTVKMKRSFHLAKLTYELIHISICEALPQNREQVTFFGIMRFLYHVRSTLSALI